MLRFLLRLFALCALLGVLGLAAAGLGIMYYLVPELPSTQSLNTVQFQVPMRVFSADEKLIAEFGEKRRVPVRIEETPPSLIDAILATEDNRFFDHFGVDWRGLLRAAWHVLKTGEKGPGGSTITMQVARNFFLGREKTYLRKLNEILLALKIEQQLSKDRILELYINKVFLGHRAYGVGAAALVYYGKSLNELTLAQYAMIAGLPQRPSAYNPIANPSQAKRRRDHVLSRMYLNGFIDKPAYEAVVNEPLSAKLYRPKIALEAPYVAEMVRAHMEKRFGDRVYTGGYRVFTTLDSSLQSAANTATTEALLDYDTRHGYRGPERRLKLKEPFSLESQYIQAVEKLPSVGLLKAALVTAVNEQDIQVFVAKVGPASIDWSGLKWARKFISENKRGKALKQAADIVAAGDIVRVKQTEDDQWVLSQIPKVQGALVSLRPDDGAILALTGGFDFYHSKFNRVIQARRQPGSNFKPFVYSSALEAGFTAATLINDAPVVFDDSNLETAWRPENYSGKFFGPTRFRRALVKSRNLVSIRILRRIGIEHALEHVQRFNLDKTQLPRDLSLALGSGTLTPLSVAAGYAVFANGGYAVEPYFIERIEDRAQQVLAHAVPLTVCQECLEQPEQPEADAFVPYPLARTNLVDVDSGLPQQRIAPRVLPAANAWIMNSILRDVIEHGTGRKAKALGRKDIAGKTGTTNDQRDAWFSGFSSHVAATAWVGFDRLEPLGQRETGGRAALPMWIKYMQAALRDTPDEIPPLPDNVVPYPIDPLTGQRTDGAHETTITEYFRVAPSITLTDSITTTNPETESEQPAAESSEPTLEPVVPAAPTRNLKKVQGATEKLF